MAVKKDLPLVEPVIEEVHPEVDGAEERTSDYQGDAKEEAIKYLEKEVEASHYEISRLKEELKVAARENLVLKEYKELFELATQTLDNIDSTINLFSKSLGILFKKGGSK